MLPGRYSPAEGGQERIKKTSSHQVDPGPQRRHQILDGGIALESGVGGGLLESQRHRRRLHRKDRSLVMAWQAWEQNIGCSLQTVVSLSTSWQKKTPVVHAIMEKTKEIGSQVIKTMAFDNGLEFAKRDLIKKQFSIKTFFTRPYPS